MFFASDNWAGAHPKISERLHASAAGFSRAYGDGELDKAVYARFSEVFEREVAVFFVATGTAANSLSLAAYGKPGGISFAHREAHILEDECGAPEYFSHGSRLYPVDGTLGRMDIGNLEQAISRYASENVHGGRPAAISITQATEVGTIYRLDHIAAVSAVARKHAVPLHMDGARFANALVSLDVSPAEMTWKRGVDIISFGGTKNGCWCAEAIVMFDLDRAREMAFLRKRSAQLFSKARFISAQFDAYFDGGLWLETARHANAMSASLAQAFESSAVARLGWQPEANEVFAIIRKDVAEKAQEAGAAFYTWPTPTSLAGQISDDEALFRFVTSFATTSDDIVRFSELLR
ncbi:low specificity L-threonine aldolase [Aminobacter sp. SR38]|jgi:threonine aldolase|uniref:threonine aldolase family protein n=1 Tax=Aminobacter sp. SR38 TaxID=2774562 RepID=UPI001781333D|nr:low specificity L-threonine aldolase [Aminobacter sp. SR38]QOF70273.1 low specificity L-threonine aldolase [Aminobacter sp. SR38]